MTSTVLAQRFEVLPANWSTGFTDEQRHAFLELVGDPDMGHTRAAAQVGLIGSKGHLRRLVRADTEIQASLPDTRVQALQTAGLGLAHLLSKLAAIVDDDDNPAQLRAIERAFDLHGFTATVRVEHTGADGAPIQVEHVRRLTLDDVRQLAERLDGPLPGARGELPAASEVLAEPD